MKGGDDVFMLIYYLRKGLLNCLSHHLTFTNNTLTVRHKATNAATSGKIYDDFMSSSSAVLPSPLPLLSDAEVCSPSLECPSLSDLLMSSEEEDLLL